MLYFSIFFLLNLLSSLGSLSQSDVNVAPKELGLVLLECPHACTARQELNETLALAPSTLITEKADVENLAAIAHPLLDVPLFCVPVQVSNKN